MSDDFGTFRKSDAAARAIVSDRPTDFDDIKDRGYYHGYLVCESIGSKPIEALFLASPDMLKALQFIVSQVTDPANASHTLGAWCHGAGLQMAKDAIAKATTIKE